MEYLSKIFTSLVARFVLLLAILAAPSLFAGQVTVFNPLTTSAFLSVRHTHVALSTSDTVYIQLPPASSSVVVLPRYDVGEQQIDVQYLDGTTGSPLTGLHYYGQFKGDVEGVITLLWGNQCAGYLQASPLGPEFYLTVLCGLFLAVAVFYFFRSGVQDGVS